LGTVAPVTVTVIPAGKTTTANGKAKIVAGSANAKLKVSFFGPFYGDYWVLDRVEDYGWAIVGEPSGRYCGCSRVRRSPSPKCAPGLRRG
jgi:apolipoprotein D and lipocalin family protein